ncbi:MAG: MFS transporter [Chloroflexi bacterium]|nr:MFS transporter [Chloroflexota bacterium]
MPEATASTAEPVRPSRLAMFALLANRDFRYYWIANFSYFLVFGAQRFAFVLLVLELTDRAGLGGVVGFALGIPAFFVTVPAGVWADRFDRRRMVLASNVGGAAVLVVVAALAWAGVLNPLLALVMALAAGVVTASVQPPLAAIVPMIVPSERLMNAIVLRTVGQNLAQFVGAAFGGLSIAMLDFGGAFALQAVFYLIAAGAVLRVRLPAAPPAPAVRPGMREATRDGMRFVFGNPALRGLVVISVISGLFMLGPVFVLIPEIARTKLEVGAGPNSLLLAFTSIGMFAVSLWLASRSQLSRKGRWFVFNLLLAGPFLIGMGLSESYVLTAGFMFLWGLGGGVFVNLNQTLIQTNTPNELMGRVMAIYSLSIAGIIPLGSLLAGAGAELIGADEYLALSGAVLGVSAVWAAITQRALREMD